MGKSSKIKGYIDDEVSAIDDLNVNGLEVKEIESLITRLEVLKKEKRENTLKEAWNTFVDTVEGLGMDLDKALADCLTKEEKNCRVLKIRYKDPENPDNVWAGRGKTPRWLREYEEQGRSKAEFKVK